MCRYGTVTSEEMAMIDENAEYLGVPRRIAMENAGRSAFLHISSNYGPLKGKRVLIVCGTGNNGGDGFVLARHLAISGVDTTVALIGKGEKIRTEEAKGNWEALQNMKESVNLMHVEGKEDVKRLSEEISYSDIVVDAIFGTGIKGDIREPWYSVIKTINDSKKLVVAIDVPSGLDPDTGNRSNIVVRASSTVTFHRTKPGLVGNEDVTGDVEVATIGIPDESYLICGPGDLKIALKNVKANLGNQNLGNVIASIEKDDLSLVALKILSALKNKILVYPEVPKDVDIKDGLVHDIRSLKGGVTLLMLSEEDPNTMINLADKYGLRLTSVIASNIRVAGSLMHPVTKRPYKLILSVNDEGLYRIFGQRVPESLSSAKELVKSLAKNFLITLNIKSNYDLVSDGKRVKASWKGLAPTSPLILGAFYGMISGFLAWGCSDLYATSSSIYLARKLQEEIERGLLKDYYEGIVDRIVKEIKL